MNQEKIKLLQARDYGELFNVSIAFIRQNFKIYFLCIFFLAGPFVLLHSIAAAYYQAVILHKVALVRVGMLYNMNAYSWEYFLSLFLQFISVLSLMCTNYSFMVVYNEKGFANFTVSDVAKKLTQHIGKIIGGFFLFLVLIVIFGCSAGFIIGLVAGNSLALSILFSICIIVAFLIFAPNLLWQLSTSFLVMILENEIPFSAFGRTREVMKNNYWWTWLIIVTASLLIVIVSFMFALPLVIFTFIKTYFIASSGVEGSSFLFIIVFVLSSFFSTLIYSILYVICGFHYFSVAEKADGKGLMERINEIGNNK